MSVARPPRWSELTAVFGGTFDPPHLGHLEAVRGLFELPGVKEVVILPSPTPPHKALSATVAQRLEMTRIGLGEKLSRLPVRIDAREIERAGTHPGQPTFSFDTLSEMRRENPNLAFVIGADQLRALPTWHRFPEVMGLCHWIVLERQPDGQGIALEAIRELTSHGLLQPDAATEWRIPLGVAGPRWLKSVPTPAQAISSTRIREFLAKSGSPPEGTLTPEVSAYLKLHRIYGTCGGTSG